MPCILKIKIVSARNLPIMDRATDLTDAFVEIKFSDYEVYKTQTQRRSLNPVWNEDFRFEVIDDSDLQNEPLELKVLDYDSITYHDSIGTVFLDLNPLLTWDTNAQISGWFPIYDTLLGVRGELNVQVKLQFFGDINPFKDSSAGVQFFTLTTIPSSHQIVSILGFVSSIDNEDDPEYHWADNFRTPRTSNEARTRVMFRLSGMIRRQVGKKVLELNGNAVIGYKQYFDLESEKRAITVRAIGTAVKLVPLHPDSSPMDYINSNTMSNNPVVWGNGSLTSSLPPMNTSRDIPISPTLNGIQKYSKSPQPDRIVESPTSSTRYLGPLTAMRNISDPMLITIHSLPPGSILALGGFVSATSIKLIDNDERAVREAWWTELREEIKSHAKALSCPFIIGYSETTSIDEELAVLNCSGTAVLLDLSFMASPPSFHGSRVPSTDLILDKPEIGLGIPTSCKETGNTCNKDSKDGSNSKEGKEEEEEDLSSFTSHNNIPLGNKASHMTLESKSNKKTRRFPGCQSCHIAYQVNDSPFPMSISQCLLCKKNHVPEMILASIEPPSELKLVGEGRLIEAHVCRQKKIRVGDTRAIYVSESIPFCQYDIHRQLTHKLRIYGLNAIFGLVIKFTIGESLMTAVATGTAVYVRGLPPPPALKLFRNLDILDEEDKELMELQRKIMGYSETNRRRIEIALAQLESNEQQSQQLQQHQESDSDADSDAESDLDFEKRKTLKSSIVVQIDDEHDEDLILLMDPVFSEGFNLCNTEYPPIPDYVHSHTQYYNIQMMTAIKESNITSISHHPNRQLAAIFKNLYQDLQAQVSYFQPDCIVTGIHYDIHLPKDNFIQISLTAVAMGLIPSLKEDELGKLEDPIEVLDPLSASNSRHSGFFQSLGFNRTDLFDLSMNRLPTRTSLVDLGGESLTSVFEDMEVFQIEEDDDSRLPMSETVTDTVNPMTNNNNPTEGGIKQTVNVEITPLSYIPQSQVGSFLGRISLHFVKEATVVYETGTGRDGLGGFTHTFLSELYAITKSHCTALGGNAVLAFSLDQVTVIESIRNQAYALISISGDVVELEYETGNNNEQPLFAQRLFS